MQLPTTIKGNPEQKRNETNGTGNHTQNIDSVDLAACQSGVGQRSNPSAERTRLVLHFAPNLAVGLHMRGTLIS